MVHNGGRSRAFSVLVKDRGAILPGGHVGKAFWFSKSSGEFVTSTYYYEDYPPWVKQWDDLIAGHNLPYLLKLEAVSSA